MLLGVQRTLRRPLASMRMAPCTASRGVKVLANKLRSGNLLDVEGRLLLVQSTKHVKPGKGGAFVQCSLKDVKSNTKAQLRFRAVEDVEVVQTEIPEEYTLLYQDGDALVLMHTSTFEQIELEKDCLSQAQRHFLFDGMTLTVERYQGEPLAVQIPKEVTCTVTSVGPELGGGSGAVFRTAVLDNGVSLKVPGFVMEEQQIVVDTTESTYVKRA